MRFRYRHRALLFYYLLVCMDVHVCLLDDCFDDLCHNRRSVDTINCGPRDDVDVQTDRDLQNLLIFVCSVVISSLYHMVGVPGKKRR